MGGAVVSEQVPEAARSAALDLHKGIDDPRGHGCKRWPEGWWLLSSQGEMVPGRCRATNLCDYCSRLFAVETSEMLMLDAMEHAPTVYAVLTARELLDRADCRRHLTQIRKSLRRRWPGIEWACLVEFQRRGALHLNLLIKGVPADDVDALHAAISRVWCSRVDALPRAQFVGPIGAAEGLVRYVTQHFMKPAQAPPIGWRGHRYSSTRGYLVRPAALMRVEAREALRGKRALRAALKAGHEGADAEIVAGQALELAAATSWRLLSLDPSPLARGERADARAAAIAAVNRHNEGSARDAHTPRPPRPLPDRATAYGVAGRVALAARSLAPDPGHAPRSGAGPGVDPRPQVIAQDGPANGQPGGNAAQPEPGGRAAGAPTGRPLGTDGVKVAIGAADRLVPVGAGPSGPLDPDASRSVPGHDASPRGPSSA